MLFMVLKSKRKDRYVGDYIRGILLELKNNMKIIDGNTAKIPSYIQLLYQTCVSECSNSRSTNLMDAFNDCFDINTYVREPWSPLFNPNGCYEELIKFNLSDNYQGLTSLTVAEIYRHGSDWKFGAIGSGSTDANLSAMLQHYSK
mgnify:CR=1 FL=1